MTKHIITHVHLKTDIFCRKLLSVTISFCLMLASCPVWSADKNIEFGVVDDFTALGTEGNFGDADTEIAGFTTFGSTDTYIMHISTEPP